MVVAKLFGSLSLIGILALLVARHLLISDFHGSVGIRSISFDFPSQASILVGKLLGVPILLYLVAGLAVPLHVWSGLAAQIPLSLILSFWGYCYQLPFLL